MTCYYLVELQFQELERCKLWYITSTSKRHVANRKLWPTEPGMMVHHVPLKSEYVKVSINNVSKNGKDENLPVSVSDELTTLVDTVNITIQRLETWIELMEMVFLIVLI